MARCFLCILLLASASAVLAQEPETPPGPMEPADPVADSLVRLVRDPGGHAAVPRRLTFTPDGKRLISTGDDRTVQIWDAASRERLRVIRPPLGADGKGGVVWNGMGLNALAVDRKGERVAFCVAVKDDKGNAVQTTFVCSLETGQAQVLKHFGPHEFTPDGAALAIAEEHNVSVVNIATGETLHTVKVAAKDPVVNVAFSPDGKTLAVVAGDAKVYLFDAGALKAKGHLAVPGKGNNLRTVSWANDDVVVCRSWSTEKNVVVLDAVKNEVKVSYSTKDLQSRLPEGNRSNESFIEINAVEGTTKALVRFKYTAAGGQWPNANYLLDWATGEGGKVFVQTSRFGCDAAAIALDLSIAAQGDGNLNDVILFDPIKGKAFHEGKDVHRLRATSRGVRGELGDVRWLPNGKGVVWEQLEEVAGVYLGFHKLDLTALTLSPLKRDAFLKYGKADADLVPGNDKPGDFAKDYQLFERGIQQKSGALHLKATAHGAEVIGGDETVPLKGPWSVCAWDFTFTPGNRVAYHPWGSNLIEVYDAATGKRLHRSRPVQSYILSWAVSPKPERPYLLVGSADQTLTIYNTATGKVLLTVYPTRSDWIAWTPQGYYAASLGGERLMGWHVDNGPDQLAGFYPAERFRKRLYRPDVIKLVLEKGSVEEALIAANAALPKEQRPATDAVADVAKMAPPTATLKLGSKNDKGVVQLTTDVTAAAGSQGVKLLRLMVDGRAIAGDEYVKRFDPPRAKVTQIWADLELPPGKHRIVVLAKGEDASSQSNALEIDTRPITERPVMYVLAVGVSKYNDKALNLNCADADAALIAKTFKDACKGELFSDVRPTVLLNENATREAVIAALTKLRKQAAANDLLVVFFAGHGAKDNDQFYLLTHEAQVDKLAATALSGRDLRGELKEVPCQVLLIMDACHSAGFGEKGKLSESNLKPATDDATRTFTDDEVGVAVMCAAMGTEEASESGTNGLFTLKLVQALTDKQVTFNRANKKQYLHHLQADVFDWVVDESKDKQHPFLHLPWVMQSFAIREVTAK